MQTSVLASHRHHVHHHGPDGSCWRLCVCPYR